MDLKSASNLGRAIPDDGRAGSGRVEGRAGTVLLLLALGGLLGGPPAAASAEVAAQDACGPDADARPSVHMISTGGTIAARPGESLSGDELVERIEAIGDVADLTVEEFSRIGSSKMTPGQWRRLSLRVSDVFRERPDLCGIIVTHGTDTMEETAFFLHLTVDDERPVVLTGAMRPPGSEGADGPANLLDAIRVAMTPDSRSRGTLVVLNDEIHSAADVQKAHTTRPDAFESSYGPLGMADPDEIGFSRSRSRADLYGRFEVSRDQTLPEVRVVYSYAGVSGNAVTAAMETGAEGIVVATMGRGNLSADQEKAVAAARRAGIPVALSSRTMDGRVPVSQDWSPDGDSEGGGSDAPLFGAGQFNPQKARILLMLALSRNRSVERIPPLFRP